MFTYLKEDRILLPNDAFGQHVATTKGLKMRWDLK